jgi:hypothetical protein
MTLGPMDSSAVRSVVWGPWKDIEAGYVLNAGLLVMVWRPTGTLWGLHKWDCGVLSMAYGSMIPPHFFTRLHCYHVLRCRWSECNLGTKAWSVICSAPCSTQKIVSFIRFGRLKAFSFGTMDNMMVKQMAKKFHKFVLSASCLLVTKLGLMFLWRCLISTNEEVADCVCVYYQ